MAIDTSKCGGTRGYGPDYVVKLEARVKELECRVESLKTMNSVVYSSYKLYEGVCHNNSTLIKSLRAENAGKAASLAVLGRKYDKLEPENERLRNERDNLLSAYSGADDFIREVREYCESNDIKTPGNQTWAKTLADAHTQANRTIKRLEGERNIASEEWLAIHRELTQANRTIKQTRKDLEFAHQRNTAMASTIEWMRDITENKNLKGYDERYHAMCHILFASDTPPEGECPCNANHGHISEYNSNTRNMQCVHCKQEAKLVWPDVCETENAKSDTQPDLCDTKARQDLKPCPNPECDNASFKIMDGRNGHCKKYQVMCICCRTRGPWANTPEAACEAWNGMLRKDKPYFVSTSILGMPDGGDIRFGDLMADHALAEKVRELFDKQWIFYKPYSQVPKCWMRPLSDEEKKRYGGPNTFTSVEELMKQE